MKFAIFSFVAVFATLPVSSSRGSESASDSRLAVETLRAGLEVHPDQAVVLFQDSLQTNPDARRELLAAALDTFGDDVESVTPLIYAARLEFPDEDSVFAEVVLGTLPELAGELRNAFAASQDEMLAALSSTHTPGDSVDVIEGGSGLENAGPVAEMAPSHDFAAEPAAMDEEIRDAIARVTAKTAGKAWPEQQVAEAPVHFKKPDEVRIPRKSRQADESSLFNHLPLDRVDEREIAPGLVKIDDSWRPSESIRLDESKFATGSKEASTSPLEAKVKAMSPAGSIGLPKRPLLPRSRVYYIPPAAGGYESTIDLENGDSAPPALIIRPESASPTSPK
ncbi:MAG: hypothetical protein JNJ70_02610 [Verrucomicrobiales bacterium]|nr:hypothetical protein [Verrucomicrobiales bacterium]